MKVYQFEAEGISNATGDRATIRIEARLAPGDVFDNEQLNEELARNIAVSDAKVYLSPIGDATEVEVRFMGTREEEEYEQAS